MINLFSVVRFIFALQLMIVFMLIILSILFISNVTDTEN